MSDGDPYNNDDVQATGGSLPPRYGGTPPSGGGQFGSPGAGQFAPPQPPPPPYGPPNAGPYGAQPYGRYSPSPPPRRGGGTWQVLLVIFVVMVFFILALGFASSVLRGGADHSEELASAGRDKIGLVRIEGTIQPGDDMNLWMDAFRQIEKNDHLKGVIIRVNSPGGAVGDSQELYEAIRRLREQKHKVVYISMGDLAASGGYYLSSAASRIFALKGTLTGSIGVVFSLPEISELAKKLGVSENTVTSGQFKDSGSPFRPMNDNDRALFKMLIDNTYNQFLDDVLLHRAEKIAAACKKLSADDWRAMLVTSTPSDDARSYLKSIADGRVVTGKQALTLGLVDDIGTYDEAVKALGSELGISGEPEVIEIKKKMGFVERLTASAGHLLPTAQAPLQFKMPWM